MILFLYYLRPDIAKTSHEVENIKVKTRAATLTAILSFYLLISDLNSVRHESRDPF